MQTIALWLYSLATWLATPLLTVLFSIFALNVFSFKGRSKSLSVALFIITVTAICLASPHSFRMRSA
ncbi:MAG TPA: hypothetical protein PLL92_13365, partial [Alicycliphilus sp.]|nr:hypothetical protein [Alicycliphilus sp.]